MCVRVCVFVCALMRVCVCSYACVQMYVCVRVSVCLCMCVFALMRVYGRACIYVWCVCVYEYVCGKRYPVCLSLSLSVPGVGEQVGQEGI